MAISPAVQDALDFLSDLARGSKIRIGRGLDFWGGYFRHRIERVRGRTLAEIGSCLMDALDCTAEHPSTLAAARRLEQWPESRIADAARAIEKYPALLVALAFDSIKSKLKSQKRGE